MKTQAQRNKNKKGGKPLFLWGASYGIVVLSTPNKYKEDFIERTKRSTTAAWS